MVTSTFDIVDVLSTFSFALCLASCKWTFLGSGHFNFYSFHLQLRGYCFFVQWEQRKQLKATICEALPLLYKMSFNVFLKIFREVGITFWIMRLSWKLGEKKE